MSDGEQGHSIFVAAKFLNSDISESHFEHELKSLLDFNSKYCPRVYTWTKVKGRWVLVTEWIEGMNLEDFKTHFRPLKEECWEILRQIQAALKEVKDAGLYHGDISPRNILLNEQGSIKLVDFSMPILSCDLLGTKGFMSPERESGAPPSYESDLYSLGEIARFLVASPSDVPYASWLNENPEDRTVIDIFKNRDAQKSIGQKISTLTNGTPSTFAVPKREISVVLVRTVFALILALSSKPSGSFSEKLDPGQLVIRSHEWVRVTINDREPAYSPTDQTVPAGRVVLRWESPRGLGKKTLVLYPGERKVLSDPFFRKRED